ncbi:HFR099Wp [Eremothecium sinecaudum]|uniref:HFR099Wp n=1 Tax=Eremothecium sinecaudum TaxID=45286 RepID=A0A0X8HV26_9SACH|nr:HFR099Wp [Eremothecium sinecaudum]AMD21954.1 HFR099Wp [Eremothecium sinecaudum]
MSTEVIDLDNIDINDELKKYASTEQEVFETSDNDESLSSNELDRSNNVMVSAEPIGSLDDTRAIFEHNVLSGHVDYSGRIDKVGLSYKSHNIEETVEQKLARIKREIYELQLSKEAANEHKDEVDELVKLFSKLEQDRTQNMRDIKHRLVLDTKESDTVSLPSVKIETTHYQKLVELDAKLADLEVYVGDKYFTNKSITTSFNELFHKVSLLEQNEELLSNFSSAMKRISKEYEESIIGRRAAKDITLQRHISEQLVTTDTKVAEIYKSYNLLKKYSESLPHIIDRLKSLNDLHRQAKDTCDTVHTVNDSISYLHLQTEKWEKLLDTMDEKLDKHESRLQENVDNIKEWIDELSLKVDEYQKSL